MYPEDFIYNPELGLEPPPLAPLAIVLTVAFVIVGLMAFIAL